MSLVRTALHVELRKAGAARTLQATTILVLTGIALLTGVLVAAAQAGHEQIRAQLGPLADESGWTLLTGVAAQITAAGALLAFGVGLSWSFGREFTDGTISGLFALPVSRATIALGKLVVHVLWTIGVAVALVLLVLLAGLLLDLGPIHADVVSALARQALLATLTGLITSPAAWVATLGRGPLPGIAATIAIVVAAQASAIAVPGTAAWVPLSAAALWALQPDAVRTGQLVLVAVVPIVSTVLTCIAWSRLRLDR